MNENKDGVRAVIEMFRKLDSPTRERMLKEISEREPKLAVIIRKNLRDFKELFDLSSNEFQILFREFPLENWALALRGLDEKSQDGFFDLMSKRAGEEIQEMIQQMGPQPLSKVEEHRLQILARAQALAQEGKIKF
jgi:flagellar motor switch protein FliG